ncbi:RnfABCDGE type electron transport complex subunit D, partial [Burkholderia sp. SIMBA_057]
MTKSATHVRDRIDLKRIMILVWMMTFPAMFWGMYNVGNQAALALADGYALSDVWQVGLFHLFGGELGANAGWG